MTVKRTLLMGSGIACAAAAAAAVALQLAMPKDPFAACRANDMVDFAEIGGSFSLTDEAGRKINDEQLINQPTLLYMGYTFCPDVCPLDNMRNAETIFLLEEQGVPAQAVFVSVDPKRDTPQVLADFTDVFHPKMIGLTGEKEMLSTMADDFHAVFEFRDEDDEFYLIDHTTFTYLLLPDHGVVDIFSRNDSATAIAERMTCSVGKV